MFVMVSELVVCWRLSPGRWVTSNKVLVLVMTHVSARNLFLAGRKGNSNRFTAIAYALLLF
jgi:hypothetical protein